MRFPWKATSAVVGVLMILAACSGDVPTGDPSPTPEFTGPYRGEFMAADSHAHTALAHKVLADSDISPDEMAEVNAVFTTCLEDLGLTDITIDVAGALSYTYPLDVTPAQKSRLDRGASACQIETDWTVIAPLDARIRLSPDGSDMTQAIADCIVRVGLRPEGYSADDFRNEMNAGGLEAVGLPDTPGYAKLYNCVHDPLHTT